MSKADALVSIVMPCYNLGLYLQEAIDSARNQTYENIEIIIVDDGSTDGYTVNLLKQISEKSSDIRVMFQANAGPSGARNTGIREAAGEFILCLDSDDILCPDYIKNVMPIFSKDDSNDIGFVTTWIQEFGRRHNIWKTEDYNPSKLLVENIVHGASIFRKEAWEKAGGYKTDMRGGYEDWDFWISIVEVGYRWVMVPEIYFMYRIRDNSVSATASKKHLELYSKILRSHGKIFSKYVDEIILMNSEKIHELHDVIKEKNAIIDERDIQIDDLNKIIEDCRSQIIKNASVEAELEQLRLSRVTAPAIRLRKGLLKAREKSSAAKSRAISFAKRKTPTAIKDIAKEITKRKQAMETRYVKNKAWPSSKPLVSIVTPFYNQGAFINETIDSVVKQTFANFEYIIVNDGSSKEDSAALKKLPKDKRIKIINHEKNIGNGSPAAARNSGIERAKGKYVMCLDSDDKLDPTYIEKCVLLMEGKPSLSVATTKTQSFGSSDEIMNYCEYDPINLFSNNIVTTAAMFRKQAWQEVGGYKKEIGYEDWEFWINLAEHGHFGELIPEPLFQYRVAADSRYVKDKKKHRKNIENIKSIHSGYIKIVSDLWRKYKKAKILSDSETAYVNLGNQSDYIKPVHDGKENILLMMPWMTFGGAETLVVNFCREIKDVYNIHFITGLKSKNEWENKFKEISQHIYHLPNLFEDQGLYMDFVSNYIKTHNIDILHIIHTDFVFSILPGIKKRHPKLKIIITMFNDRVPHYFQPSIDLEKYVDVYTSDNLATVNHYKELLPANKKVKVIPNGINCVDNFNPTLYDRDEERAKLQISDNDLAVFFVGRLSEEKNPNVFIEVAKKIIDENKKQNVKFFVIGDGPMRSAIEEQIKSIKGLGVKYLGYQTDIARFLSAADVFVLPSSIEGFPLSILEAMAMRLVVISSNVGAVPDVITDGVDGYVVDPGSVDQIHELILKLLGNRRFAEKIKVAARKKLENKYSNAILKKNYIKLYRNILK